MFGKRAGWNIVYAPKGQKGTGGWRKLHNKELHTSHTSSSKEVEMGGACNMQQRPEMITQFSLEKVKREDPLRGADVRIIFCRIDPLLGNHRETTRQRPLQSNGS